MAQTTGLGTVWNLPNFSGELFTSDATQTPLLSMTGGLTGGGKITDNFEFPTSVLFNNPDSAQPSISETDSATAPAASHLVRTQEYNVVQIHQEVIDLTYVKQSNMGRMSGLNTAGQTANPPSEMDFQTSQKLIKIARDIEHSFISGEYQKSTSSAVANKTRGMLELTSQGTSIAAAGAPLSRDLLSQIYREMADNGAYFDNMVMFVPAYLKQVLTDLYSQVNGFGLPQTRNIGGLNIQEIETDFFKMGVVWSRFMPKDSILIADVAHISPVFQAVPGKGILFTEPLAKIGASERIQMFGQVGLDHGAAFLHASITGIENK